MVGDWIYNNLGWCIVGLVGIVLGLLGWAIYEDVTAEKFSLRKDEWQCVRSHQQTVTTTIVAGKVIVPQVTVHTVCDQWDRK